MIEDLPAVPDIAAIASVEGIDIMVIALAGDEPLELADPLDSVRELARLALEYPDRKPPRDGQGLWTGARVVAGYRVPPSSSSAEFEQELCYVPDTSPP